MSNLRGASWAVVNRGTSRIRLAIAEDNLRSSTYSLFGGLLLSSHEPSYYLLRTPKIETDNPYNTRKRKIIFEIRGGVRKQVVDSRMACWNRKL